MKLDRNITNPKRGKYALIKLRDCVPVRSAEGITFPVEAVDFGDTEDTDFFVIRLKDKYASVALRAYALAAGQDGQTEYADEIHLLADQSLFHPNRKLPD